MLLNVEERAQVSDNYGAPRLPSPICTFPGVGNTHLSCLSLYCFWISVIGLSLYPREWTVTFGIQHIIKIILYINIYYIYNIIYIYAELQGESLQFLSRSYFPSNCHMLKC